MNAASTKLKLRGLIRLGLHLESAAGTSEAERRWRHRQRVETLISLCWALIAAKCFVVVWLVNHYHMPFNPLWVVAPTVTFAFVATAAYYWLRD